LRDKVSLAGDWLGPDAAVMFVAPDNEIDVVIKKTLWNKFLWSMFDPGYIIVESFKRSEVPAPILVQE
jgi:hypothetical protein